MITETLEFEGHIIDSLLLPKVLDSILAQGADFEIETLNVGKLKEEPSYVRIKVTAPDQASMNELLTVLAGQGAHTVSFADITLQAAEQDGVFPEDFYSTTNLSTQVRLHNAWLPVQNLEMDCGIVVDTGAAAAICTPMHRIRKGDQVVVGHDGIRVTPPERPDPAQMFEFMGSEISPEKPKDALVNQVAEYFRAARADGKRIVLTAGPAVVHTGGAPAVAELINRGYINVLFAGNGLATHDIESSLYGTSLGVRLADNVRVPGGHRNHLRAINTVRRLGSIKAAVDAGVVTSGIMYSCIKMNIPFILAASVRDDGPLPDVMADVLGAIDRLRGEIRDASLVLCLATTIHSVAIGNILPASTRMVIIDINPAALTKLSDRGSWQSLGIVADAGTFVTQLADRLRKEP